MSIQTLTFTEYVQQWVNTWAASMSTPTNPVDPNLPLGNVALAVAQADANQATVLQYMAVRVIAFARAQTSTGPDLDSFYAQFNFFRLQSQFAMGTVTFSAAAVVENPLFIPIGTEVQTNGGGIIYQVIADPTNANYLAPQQVYQLPIGQSSVIVKVQAEIAGVAFNVQAGQLIQLLVPLSGITGVTNATKTTGGLNQETDAAFRSRFVQYINGLSRATEDAIAQAVEGIQSGLKVALLEQVIPIGNPPTGLILAQDNPLAYGHILVLIDDGSGTPSDALITQGTDAVVSTIAYGIQYAVMGPAIIAPPIAMNVKLMKGVSSALAEAAIALQVQTFLNSLPIGGALDDNDVPFGIYLGQIAEQAFIALPGQVITTEPGSITINGVAADFAMAAYQEAIVPLTSIVIGTY